MAKGQVFARSDGDGTLAEGEQEADRAEQGGQQAERGQSPALIENHPERRAEGQSAIGGDAVEGDDFGGVLGSGAGDAPESCTGGTEAFAHSQGQAAQNERGKGEPGLEVEGHGGEKKQSAEGAGGHAPEDGDFGAGAVGDAAGPGPAEEGGDVLDADDQACQSGVQAHAQVHKGGQDSERQADGEITDKGEVYETEDGTDRPAGGEGR